MTLKSVWLTCRNQSGAIMTEVLMSLVIFTIGMTSAFALLIHSVQLNSINKNRITAVNLAQEALEVVKSIRDTNWLTYSSNRRECWNFSPDGDESGVIGDDSADECTLEAGQNNHPFGVLGDVGAGLLLRSFIVDFDENNRWLMLPASEYPDTTLTPQVFSAYDGSTANGQVNSIITSGFGLRTPRLYIASGRYTHLPDGATETFFYRVVDICYLDNVESGEDCSNSGLFPTSSITNYQALDNRIKVTARVYWKEKTSDPNFKSVTLETTLTDYLSRTEWDS